MVTAYARAAATLPAPLRLPDFAPPCLADAAVPDAEYLCACTAELAAVITRAANCDACRDTGQPCPTPRQHIRTTYVHTTATRCTDPEPVACEHHGCRDLHRIDMAPCTTDHVACCGCCQPDDLFTD